MNSAAVHSAKLIAAFEKQQQEDQEPVPTYPSEHPFGADRPGPFGGGAAETEQGQFFTSFPLDHHSHSAGGAFAADNEMSNFDDWDAGYAGAPPAAAAAHSTDVATYSEAGPLSRSAAATTFQPRALTPYDYPGGWGAQTFSGVGGLTQDSASRIATLQAKLNQRLGPEYLSQRPGPGGGKKLTYIEGWKLVDLANEVFGFNGWSTTIVRLDVDFLDCSPDGTRFTAGVSCVVRVTLRDGAFHEDIGYGSAENARQKHAALEKGKKEAVTDATKRALKNFGKLLGNCTYDHQYSTNALKVSNPAPKFDASELHRRPELRPPPPPQPQPPQAVAPQPMPAARPPAPPSAAAPRAGPIPAPPAQSNAISNGNAHEASAPSSAAQVRAAPTTMAAPQQPVSAHSAALSATNARRPHNTISNNSNNSDIPRAATVDKESANERRAVEEASKDGVAERQQRSLLARQAYLERQQAEAQRAPATEQHHAVVSAQRPPRAAAAAEMEFGSDSFDDGLNDVLATYDETEMGEAEAASRALEMEIDESHRARLSAEDGGDVHPNYNAADDSGVAFPTCESDAMQVKLEKVRPIEMRRSTSPVKQVKMEAAKVPRRAGSVGRFVSPPPAQRNGSTSLSAASSSARMGGQGGARRIGTTTLVGIGGVEGAASREAGAGRAVGEAVNHGYVVPEATFRGIKRAGEPMAGTNARRLPPPLQAQAAVANSTAAARQT